MAGIADADKLHFQVIVKGTIAALDMSTVSTYSTLHYRRSLRVADFNPTNFITAFHAMVKADWKALASASWSWGSTSVRCIDDAADGGIAVDVGEVGGVGGECLPAFNQQLVAKYTAFRGKHYRGRLFVPSVPESSVDGNTLKGTALAALQTMADDIGALITDADDNQYVPWLFSASLSQILTNPTTVIGEDVIAMFARDPIAVLKGRKAKAA
jgi:hypothetical protein